MRDEEGEQDDGYPELLQSDLANLCLVRWQVVCERRRPDLRSKVAGYADEEAGEYQSLCELSARTTTGGLVLPVGPLK